jgi:hypothetical protein
MIYLLIAILILWSVFGFIEFKNWVQFTAYGKPINNALLYFRILVAGPVAWFAALVAFLGSLL